MMRLIQLKHPKRGRCVAVVDQDQIALLQSFQSIYDLAFAAISCGEPLAKFGFGNLSGETLNYDSIYQGESDWHLLPAFDHPEDPARCLVTGTGLTHKASAKNR